jgi:hypothetical protein
LKPQTSATPNPNLTSLGAPAPIPTTNNGIPEVAPIGDPVAPEFPDDVPFTVNPAPADSLPQAPAQKQASLDDTSAGLPAGFHHKPTALPPSTPQYYLPTQVTSQQAIRDWERRFSYEATAVGDAKLIYKPVLLAQVVVRYLDRKIGIEEDQRWAFQVPNLEKAGIVRWSEYQATPIDPGNVSDAPMQDDAYFGNIPTGVTDSKRMTALKPEVIDYVYRTASLPIYFNETLDLYGKPRENRRDFLLRAQQKARELRDGEIDKVTARYDGDLQKLEERRRRELREVTYDKQALEELKREELYTTGEAVLGLMRGRTAYTLSRMSRSRRYKKQAQERAMMGQQSVADIEHDIATKQEELQKMLTDVNEKWAKIAGAVDETKVTAYKKDVSLEVFGLGWIPAWYVQINGQMVTLPAYAVELKPAAPSQNNQQ